MSKTGRTNYRRGERGTHTVREPRHITVRSVRKDQPDLRKLSRAVIAQALAEANAEKAADATWEQDAATKRASAPTARPDHSAEVPHD